MQHKRDEAFHFAGDEQGLKKRKSGALAGGGPRRLGRKYRCAGPGGRVEFRQKEVGGKGAEGEGRQGGGKALGCFGTPVPQVKVLSQLSLLRILLCVPSCQNRIQVPRV